MQLLQIWWVWVAAGVLLGCLEVISPGYIFLGFAAGAVATGGLVLVGLQEVMGGAGVVATFALISLACWIAMRRLFGGRGAQVKIWRRDINED